MRQFWIIKFRIAIIGISLLSTIILLNMSFQDLLYNDSYTVCVAVPFQYAGGIDLNLIYIFGSWYLLIKPTHLAKSMPNYANSIIEGCVFLSFRICGRWRSASIQLLKGRIWHLPRWSLSFSCFIVISFCLSYIIFWDCKCYKKKLVIFLNWSEMV